MDKRESKWIEIPFGDDFITFTWNAARKAVDAEGERTVEELEAIVGWMKEQ